MTSKKFSYELPGGGPNDLVTIDPQGNIKFDPPVYEQRYSTAIRILEDSRWHQHFKKIIDIGCGEMSLLRFMRRLDYVEHIVNVDVDEDTLKSHLSRAMPLLADHLKSRDRPLRVEVFQGSLIHAVEDLRNADVVVALEVIEHLWPDVLEKFPINVFGFIQPKLVIVSTPNSEYNVLFNGLNANGFRIDDHKFEWTRKEFEEWASAICEKYPNYAYATLGVGSAPENRKELGTVTQFAIFARSDIIDRELVHPIRYDLEANTDPEVQYKRLFDVDFPFRIDNRSKKEKLKDEITYYLSYAHRNERYYNEDLGLYEIPLNYLIGRAEELNATKDDLYAALVELKLKFDDQFIILTQKYVDDEYNFPCSHFGLDCDYSDASCEEGLVAKNATEDVSDEENWD